MSVPEALTRLAGRWRGESALWLSPDAPPRTSTMAGRFELTGRGQFATWAYTWSDAGQDHEGLLVLACGADGRAARMAWVDSFHTMHDILQFEGTCESSGATSATGSYRAPPGPDWGWRIEVTPDDQRWTLTMHNIAPNGDEAKAVEATLVPDQPGLARTRPRPDW